MVRPLIIHNTLICFYFKLFVTKKTSSRSTAFVSLRVWHCGVGGGGVGGGGRERERERERVSDSMFDFLFRYTVAFQ